MSFQNPHDTGGMTDGAVPDRARRPMELRPRLIIVFVSLLLGVLSMASAYFISENRRNMLEAMKDHAQSVREELATKGLSLARTIARSSESALATGNYFFLTQVVRGAAADDAEIVYGIIMDESRRAVVHTDRGHGGTILEDETSHRAAAQIDDGVLETRYEDAPALEAIAPIQTGKKRWGIVRLGLSLDKVERRLAETEFAVRRRMFAQMGIAAGAAVLLALFASLITAIVAKWMTRPLEQLLGGVHRVSKGDLTHTVSVTNVGEFVDLAAAFNAMTAAVRKRAVDLEAALQTVEQALRAEEEANRLKSEFMANVSHELRTPLNAIINVPSVLLGDFPEQPIMRCVGCKAAFALDYYDDDDEGHAADDDVANDNETDDMTCPECAEVLRLESRVVFTGSPFEHRQLNSDALKAGRHLLSVVTDILDFSRIEAGRMTLTLEEIDVAQVLSEVETTVAPLAAEKNQSLQMVLLKPLQRMVADSVKVSQILVNLIGNAVKFTAPGGKIRVTAELVTDRSAERVRFSVNDTGEGIPEAALASIFERFRQADGGHTRRHGGTGLGLAIAKSLVELHYGTISVQSTLGVGSTFTVDFPRVANVQPRSEESILEGSTGQDLLMTPGERKPRVLVLEDDASQSTLIGRVLEEAGFDVERRVDATEIEDALYDRTPDLIILDIMLPRVSGLTVLREVKEDDRTSQVPVLVSTAYHQNRDIVRKLGGFWLPKPWEAEDLLRAVMDGLKGRTKTQ